MSGAHHPARTSIPLELVRHGCATPCNVLAAYLCRPLISPHIVCHSTALFLESTFAFRGRAGLRILGHHHSPPSPSHRIAVLRPCSPRQWCNADDSQNNQSYGSRAIITVRIKCFAFTGGLADRYACSDIKHEHGTSRPTPKSILSPSTVRSSSSPRTLSPPLPSSSSTSTSHRAASSSTPVATTSGRRAASHTTPPPPTTSRRAASCAAPPATTVGRAASVAMSGIVDAAVPGGNGKSEHIQRGQSMPSTSARRGRSPSPKAPATKRVTRSNSRASLARGASAEANVDVVRRIRPFLIFRSTKPVLP